MYTYNKEDRNSTHRWTLHEQTELFTVSELHGKISSSEEKDLNVYCLQFFEPGYLKVVCFTDIASTILSEQW